MALAGKQLLGKTIRDESDLEWKRGILGSLHRAWNFDRTAVAFR